MVRSLNSLLNHRIVASDGFVGTLKDFYFDDREWIIRYFIVDTGRWLPGRRILLSPTAAEPVDWSQGQIPLGLSKQQIESSPSIEEDKPVSRQMEEQLVRHYGWPVYWAGPVSVGAAGASATATRAGMTSKGDAHLRSYREVKGYRIEAVDGEVGHVEDLIVTERDHAIQYMVVDTRNWLPGRKVLVAPWMIKDVDWKGSSVAVEMTRAQIEGSPAFNANAPVNRAYEAKYYDYYGRPVYWSD